ncbi:MAG TPA: flagellar hook capping FlgD N-terminal domain-containing protein [Devosia sp.]|jgi:flagellar basal-body rod modification protein FlgD|nr:flagellar hook capping FlgD N-terminal domain-containing protein [Devosia sp.]
MTVSGVSGTSTASDTSGLSTDSTTIAGNFDEFLQLLTTQLQNQNPLDPLDTNQFTQQLVEFSGVEQQLKTNDYLSSLVGANSDTVNTSAVNYIGKTVSASGVQSELVNNSATWNYTLPSDANVSLDIKDSSGNVVFSEKDSVQAGSGTFAWDGKDNEGNVQPAGTYSISMTGTDSSGKVVNISTQTTGTVTGVDFTGSEPVLLVGSARLNLSDVTEVDQPSS